MSSHLLSVDSLTAFLDRAFTMPTTVFPKTGATLLSSR